LRSEAARVARVKEAVFAALAAASGEAFVRDIFYSVLITFLLFLVESEKRLRGGL
jgi:hypothetical protein